MGKRTSPELESGRNDNGLGGNGRDETIYRNLFTAIVENHLAPGTKLPEDTLAETYGVSRTSIRKVLQRLTHERLVDVRLNRGASVAQPSVGEARDIFSARRVIECGAIPLVVSKATPAALDGLRDLVRRETAAQERGDWRESIYLSGAFHVALIGIAGNETLTDFLTQLVSRSSLAIATYGSPQTASCRHSEHDDVITIIAGGDVEGAMQWMDRHLRDVERTVVFAEEEPAAADLKKILEEVAQRRTKLR
ncbi:MAG: GntR family transcriptional regulator [Proteobacteria bacterium]|nr:GntR family transcriptional regulator [Pseudomonadota bacterium]